jgi:hypothetical protein
MYIAVLFVGNKVKALVRLSNPLEFEGVEIRIV